MAAPKEKRKSILVYRPEVGDKLLEYWRATHNKRAACGHAAIDRETLRLWLIRGAEGEEPFSSFSASWEKAEADWIAERELVIRKAANEGQWQAAAWGLERHLPDEYGKKDRLGIGQDPTAEPVGVKHGRLDDSDGATVLDILGAAGGLTPEALGGLDADAEPVDTT